MKMNDATAHAETRPAAGSLLEHGTWKVRADASTVGFRVKKMGLYHVKGRFTSFDGSIEFPSDSDSPRGELEIEASSISTRIPPRDWHLRSGDFLGVKQHPRIRVRVDRIEADGHGAFGAPAAIEIRGREEPVGLSVHAHSGSGEERSTQDRTRIHVHGVVDRHDFGIRGTPPVEWVVAPEVHLDAELVLERVA
jgi:polyisoprenoid-binding protein YceI